MNALGPPPSRESIANATLDMSRQSVSISSPHSSWMDWFSKLLRVINETQETGTTAQRPSPPPFIGFMYFDTDLGQPIWAETSSIWVDATGTPV